MTDHAQGPSSPDRIIADQDAFLARVDAALEWARITKSEFARRLGVRQPTVTEWWTKRRVPMGEILLRFPEVLGVDGHWLLTGEGEYLREGPAAPDQIEAEGMFRHFEGMVRQMGGAGDVDPAELKLRRLDALEGLRRLFSAAGEVPGWWFRLKDQVERDEL